MLKGVKNNLIAYFLLFVIIGNFFYILSTISPDFKNKLSDTAAVIASLLIFETNQERAEKQIPELKENPTLTKAAQLKANSMAEKGYFSHTDPEGNSPWYYLNLAGYKYEFAGENLAVNFVESKEVHKAWMNSATHKANIIQPKFTEIGIATAEGVYKGKKAVFVVQFFGTPKIDTQ